MARIMRRTPESEEAASYGYGDFLKEIIGKAARDTYEGFTRRGEGPISLGEKEMLEMGLAGVGAGTKIARGLGKGKFPFSLKTTDVPLWDAILKKPGYHKKEKGITRNIEFMSPEEYFNKLQKGRGLGYDREMQLIDEELVTKYAQEMREGAKFPMPGLEYKGGKFEQEGRHRALAAEMLGIDRIPVLTVKSGTRTGLPSLRNLEETAFRKPANLAKRRLSKVLGEIKEGLEGGDLSEALGKLEIAPERFAANPEKYSKFLVANYKLTPLQDKEVMLKAARYVLDNPEKVGETTIDFQGRAKKVLMRLGKPEVISGDPIKAAEAKFSKLGLKYDAYSNPLPDKPEFASHQWTFYGEGPLHKASVYTKGTGMKEVEEMVADRLRKFAKEPVPETKVPIEDILKDAGFFEREIAAGVSGTNQKLASEGRVFQGSELVKVTSEMVKRKQSRLTEFQQKLAFAKQELPKYQEEVIGTSEASKFLWGDTRAATKRDVISTLDKVIKDAQETVDRYTRQYQRRRRK